MKTLTFLICILLAMLSFATGVYLGVYEMFIGGIVDMIDAVKTTPTDAFGIAVGIAKVIFFEIPIDLHENLPFTLVSYTPVKSHTSRHNTASALKSLPGIQP